MRAVVGSYFDMLEHLPTAAREITFEERLNAFRKVLLLDEQPLNNAIFADEERGIVLLVFNPGRLRLVDKVEAKV